MIDHREEFRYATTEQITQATGCTTATAKRWKAKPDSMPEMARRLIAYQNCYELAPIWGKDWEHFQFHSGQLFAPGWREGFTPEQIQFMFFQVQDVGYLRAQVRQLERDLQRERERCEVLERHNYFYRSQVSREARFGMMVERVFG